MTSTAHRFRPIRELGRGGMGAVLLVHDAERGQEVALKRSQQVAPRPLLRLKREFRAVEQLLHPALVRLHELGQDEGGLYYTMEVVAGVDLLSYCRHARSERAQSGLRSRETIDTLDASGPTVDASASAPTLDASGSTPLPSSAASGDASPVYRASGVLDVERLAVALPGLLEGLAFLHAHGVVHRDLKPDNILVRPDGAVKILDFGVLAELGRPAGQEVVGTIGYMAPEQARGAPPTPACDLYAVGAILFELATGRLPFEGPPLKVLQATIAEPPPPVETFAPDAPAPVARACARLLVKDPASRATLAELSDELLPALGARPAVTSVMPRSSPSRPSRSLLGRDADAAAVTDALRGPARGVALEGPSGVGKTALAEAVARRAEASGVVVLRGQGRASDRVPYGALDAALDALAPHVGPAVVDRCPDAVRIAAHGFVGLGTSEAAARLEPLATEPTRHAVFESVAEILEAVGGERGVWLLLDDLQWADADCLALLTHLLDDGPPSLRLIATARDDVGEQAALRWLAERDDVARHPVAPLPNDQIRALLEQRMRELRGAAAGELDPATLEAAVQASEGRPFLAEVVARSLENARGGQPALTALVDRARTSHETLLALLVAADAWTEAAELAALERRPPGAVLDAVRDLEDAGVVRSAGARGPARRVDFYHDAIRGKVRARLGPERLSEAHRAFADRLATQPGASLLRRVRHLLGAGDPRGAAALAPDAAAEARAQQAFGLSADMMALAVEAAEAERADGAETLGPLLDRMAADLERSARYREAAECYGRLAEILRGPDRAEAMLREAAALLAARRIGEGYRRLDEALAAFGERRGGALGLRGLWAGIRFLRGPRRRRVHAVDAPGDTSSEAERDVRAGVLIAYLDPLEGIRFLLRAAERFERRGLRERAAWCFYYLAMLAAFSQVKAGPSALADRYEEAARALMGDAPPTSGLLRAFPIFLEGYRAIREDRPEAAERLAAALHIVEREGRGGTFEHLLAMSIWVNAAISRQRVPAARDAVERFRRATRDAPDTAMVTHLVFVDSMVRTFEGAPEEALERLDDIGRHWPTDPPTLQLTLMELYRSLPCLYLPDERAVAWRRLDRVARRDRRFRVHESLYGAFLASQQAMTKSLALRAGDREVPVRAIRRHARAAADGVPILDLGARRAVAYLEDHLGRPERAIRALEEAEAIALARDCPMDRAIARHQRGRRVGGDEGAELRRSAHELMVSIGAAPSLLHEDPGDV